MNWSQRLSFIAFLIVVAAIVGTRGVAVVSGTVFCDQCKDGQISAFDYPLNGIKVTMACRGSDGQLTMWREETTNWLGNYNMRFDGTPNLDGCYAQVSGKEQGSSDGCVAVGGPARYLRQMFNMFDMEMYTVDPLLAQPPQPMSFCPRSSPSPVPINPPPVKSPPAAQLPPLPHLPPMPPVPFLEASACPHQRWMMPEYRCYWKVVSPDAKVGVVFGLLAARRYGTDLTLWRGLQGRGDPYRTLLREGTTALLNSYNSIQFPYHPLAVIQHMNWALMGSTRQVLHTALHFMKANSGVGINATCRFNTCN